MTNSNALALVCAGVLVASGTMALSGQQPTPTPIATIHGPANLVELQDGRAYIVGEKTLTIADVSNPAAPVRLGSYSFPEKIWGIRVVGTTVYAAADFYGLGIVDVSNPNAPVLRGSLKTPGQAKNVAIIGTTALVADHMSGLDIIDISDPAKPTTRGSFFLEGYARDVTSSGTTAFAIDAPAGLYTFDLSKPGPLEPVASQQSARAPASIELAKSVDGKPPELALLVGGGLLQIYDIKKPAAPVRVGTFKTPGGRPSRVTMMGSQAYVADGREGVQIVDLSNPAEPKLAGTLKTPAPARDVAVSDTAILVAAGAGEEEGEVLVFRR
jgi:hypothetical protein